MPEKLNEKGHLLNTFDCNFLPINVKGLQSSKKQLKVFNFLRIRLVKVVSCFCKKHILGNSRKKNGVMNLMPTYFSYMVKQILAVL